MRMTHTCTWCVFQTQQCHGCKGKSICEGNLSRCGLKATLHEQCCAGPGALQRRGAAAAVGLLARMGSSNTAWTMLRRFWSTAAAVSCCRAPAAGGITRSEPPPRSCEPCYARLPRWVRVIAVNAEGFFEW